MYINNTVSRAWANLTGPESVCRLCPRLCGASRLADGHGFCRTSRGLAIAAITLHRGEEPVLVGEHGVCNIFFSHCNLRCRFCQNVQISDLASPEREWTLAQVLERVLPLLDAGVTHLGFVSPSHMVPQMVAIIEAVRDQGRRPVVVYNSNGYDRVDTLRRLDAWVDVYLPDFKYSSSALAGQWSAAADYPEVAMAALAEMYRQRGNVLHLDSQGLAERGLIVRHLVLPGAVDNSLRALALLAERLSNRVSLSLMAQYQPTDRVARQPPLNRRLHPEEYALVVAELDRLGFSRGWVQDCSSADCYCPDFTLDAPFGEDCATLVRPRIV